MRNGMIERLDGTRMWYQNDRLHRLDGPAIEWSNGTRSWWVNDELHREDGPAVERGDGDCSWWLNDIRYTEEEHKTEMRLRRCGLSTNVPYEWKKSNA